jgi:hypothetical protein
VLALILMIITGGLLKMVLNWAVLTPSPTCILLNVLLKQISNYSLYKLAK